MEKLGRSPRAVRLAAGVIGDREVRVSSEWNLRGHRNYLPPEKSPEGEALLLKFQT